EAGSQTDPSAGSFHIAPGLPEVITASSAMLSPLESRRQPARPAPWAAPSSARLVAREATPARRTHKQRRAARGTKKSAVGSSRNAQQFGRGLNWRDLLRDFREVLDTVRG